MFDGTAVDGRSMTAGSLRAQRLHNYIVDVNTARCRQRRGVQRCLRRLDGDANDTVDERTAIDVAA
jgi:hypothetical protein